MLQQAKMQIRELKQKTGQYFEYSIVKVFSNNEDAYDPEEKVINKNKRVLGENSLLGNKEKS